MRMSPEAQLPSTQPSHMVRIFIDGKKTPLLSFFIHYRRNLFLVREEKTWSGSPGNDVIPVVTFQPSSVVGLSCGW